MPDDGEDKGAELTPVANGTKDEIELPTGFWVIIFSFSALVGFSGIRFGYIAAVGLISFLLIMIVEQLIDIQNDLRRR